MSFNNSSTSNLSRNPKKCVSMRILLLDNTILTLQLLEYDYFGLEYSLKESQFVWLDHEKALVKQVSHRGDYTFQFSVKFYTPHPNLLEDEYTRYLFTLQIKRDLFSPSFICNENTAALLGGFIVQGELGNFIEGVYNDTSYIRSIEIFKNESEIFLQKVMECHKNLVGQTPADADFNLLDTVRKVEMYGLRLKNAKDVENCPIQICVCHSGIITFKRGSRSDSFSWVRIRKLCFKRKTFILKLHPEHVHPREFNFDSRDDCKQFWRSAIENHAFFRCQAMNRRRSTTKSTSSFKYTGRTQKELMDQVKSSNNLSKSTNFERSASTGRMIARVRNSLPPLVRVGGGASCSNGVMTDVGAQASQTITRRLSSTLAAGYNSTPSVRTSEQVRRGLGHKNSTAISANSEAMTLSSCGSPSRVHSMTNSVLDINRPSSPLALQMPVNQSNEPVLPNTTGKVNRLAYIATCPDGTKKAVLLSPMVDPYSTMHASLVSSNNNTNMGTIQRNQSAETSTIPAILRPQGPQQLPGRILYLDPVSGQILIPSNASAPAAGIDASSMGSLLRPQLIRAPNQPQFLMMRQLGQNHHQPQQHPIRLITTSHLPQQPNSHQSMMMNNGQKVQSLENSPRTDSELSSSIKGGCNTSISGAIPGQMLNLCQSPKVSSSNDEEAASNLGYDPSNSSIQRRAKKQGPPLPERRDSISSKNHGSNNQESHEGSTILDRTSMKTFTPLTYDTSKMEMIEDPDDPETTHSPPVMSQNDGQFIRGRMYGGLSSLSLAASRHSLAALGTNDGEDVDENSTGPTSPQQNDTNETPHGNNILRRVHSKPDLTSTTDSSRNASSGNTYATIDVRQRSTVKHQKQQQQQEQKISHQHQMRSNSALDDPIIKPKDIKTTNGIHQGKKKSVGMTSPSSLGVVGGDPTGRSDHLAYHIIFNLVMNERTYRRDLAIISNNFRKYFSPEETPVDAQLPSVWTRKLFGLISPLHELHSAFLKDLESRLSVWEATLVANKNSRTNSTNSTTNSNNTSPATTPNSDNSCKSSSNHLNHITGNTSADGLGNNNSNSKHNQHIFGDIFGQSRREHHASSMNVTYRVGDLFVANLKMLPMYRAYLAELESLILDLERILSMQPKSRLRLRDFEANKVCYVPVIALLLKPAHRIIAYRNTLELLMRNYTDGYVDMQDCRVAHVRLLDVIQSQWEAYKKCENLYKLLEIQRDLTNLSAVPEDSVEVTSKDVDLTMGLRPLVCLGGRQFIREGYLQKLTKKGYQARMFFLFSDQLVYASRIAGSQLRFKVHGQFHLSELIVEEAEAMHSFTVYSSGNRYFLVTAANDWIRDRWLEDCSRAILAINAGISIITPTSKFIQSALKNSPLTRDFLGKAGKPVYDEPVIVQDKKSDESNSSQNLVLRATTSVHVCWQRNLTYSMTDILRMNEFENSGYLLRKFKNSNGWQKLWVVFTNICLFFYKSYNDEAPLASLPILGYTISLPDPTKDPIKRLNVFKLQFKNHVYYFRGDSEHSFRRWFECLSSAILNCSPTMQQSQLENDESIKREKKSTKSRKDFQ